MNTDKDYYAVLGIAPGAEDIVVRAAYRALAQKYHPDRYTGDPRLSEERIREINEAYEVLADTANRGTYDSQRKDLANNNTGAFDDEAASDLTGDAPLASDEDWNLAVSFYPELRDLEKGLRQLSYPLSYAFAAYILETRKFSQARKIAEGMENEFLQRYFGSNPLIQIFACQLISRNQRSAAKTLNNIVHVLGPDTPARTIIGRVIREHKISNYQDPEIVQILEAYQNNGEFGFVVARRLVELLHGNVVEEPNWMGYTHYRVSFKGKSYKLELLEFIKWAEQEVLRPMIPK